MENIPAVFSQVPYEMFKLEQERFYAERRGRIIKFKRDDSEIFKIIGGGVEKFGESIQRFIDAIAVRYNSTPKVSIPVGNWGLKSFGMIHYVQLLNSSTGDVLAQDSATFLLFQAK